MQTQEDVEPTVRIREVKKDRVNFVLGNVDLGVSPRIDLPSNPTSNTELGSRQIRQFSATGHDGRHTHCWFVLFMRWVAREL